MYRFDPIVILDQPLPANPCRNTNPIHRQQHLGCNLQLLFVHQRIYNPQAPGSDTFLPKLGAVSRKLLIQRLNVRIFSICIIGG